MTEAQALRAAILAASLDAIHGGEIPEAAQLYVPPSHLKALRLNAQVVTGGRGVGKSFWAMALQSDRLRGLLGTDAPELANVKVHVGFSALENIDHYPNADVFASFIEQGGVPYDLWRAVILRWIARTSGQAVPDETWPATVQWLKTQPESAARLMQAPRDWQGLIVFDALDRTSTDWRRMDDIVRGLLRAVLWLNSQHGPHAKVFLREDQAERTVFDFPDASKLFPHRAELTWERHDLHGLLWQRLINAPQAHGDLMRNICSAQQVEGVWQVADEMKRETPAQRKAFERLAGPWMGRDKRRGVPYVWCASHLADSRGQTSPRSFLAAIRQAAEDSSERYPDHSYALHFDSIKRGIQKASEIRVQEIAEDYPWVKVVLSALARMNVPAPFDNIVACWESQFPNGPGSIPTEKRLPAQHAARGWEGIEHDLQRLGLLKIRKDGRIDMPDLYRVGFGLGRKGGVKPKN